MYTSVPKPSAASKQPASACFRPPARQIADARLALADAKSQFASLRPISLPNASDAKGLEAPLTACFIAISEWRKLSNSLASGTPEWIEAQLALGRLYSMRGMLCKRNYEELLISGKKAGIWVMRSSEALETALSFFEAAAKCGLPGVSGQALKPTFQNMHEEIFWSYYTATMLSLKKGRISLPYPQLAKLGGLPGKAGGYAAKAAYHNAMSSKLGEELYCHEE